MGEENGFAEKKIAPPEKILQRGFSISGAKGHLPVSRWRDGLSRITILQASLLTGCHETIILTPAFWFHAFSHNFPCVIEPRILIDGSLL
jgi:hypothetical protein